MVGGPVGGHAEHRERPRGVRTAGVHRRRVEHERRGRGQLRVHRRPIHLGIKVKPHARAHCSPNISYTST